MPIPRAILEYLGDKRSLPGDAQLFPFLCNAFGYMYLKPLSHMMLQGASLAEVKELLGHRNLESTAIYLYYIPIAIRSAGTALPNRQPCMCEQPASRSILY